MKHFRTSEVAKLIRNELKAKFPTQKFSVRSHNYSGGSSIDVDWWDGPTQKAVDAIVKKYQGQGFDGMIDMAYYKKHYQMPDGSIVFGGHEGTSGSGGVYQPVVIAKPEGAEEVTMGVSYIFTNRTISEEFEKKCQVAFECLPVQRQCDLYNHGDMPRWDNVSDGRKYAHIVSPQEVA